MKNNYKLSVVVLVYNTEQYLRECFDSLVNQTLEDIEIIIVNDESPDNSHLIMDEYEKKYKNVKVINQKNSGGAVAGNNGLKIASGEYVTIMDSDDIVPLDAYEKLYRKAKETDADIAMGRANIIIDGVIKEIIYKKERDVWQTEKVVENIEHFTDIFYDGFYWNKIYRKELIFNNNCFMPPGMLYADRPMVHKAYLHANKIAIIEDIVYIWRKRGNISNKSITQLRNDIDNLKDRIESLRYQIKYFKEFGNESLMKDFLKTNIERLLFPIKGIIDNREFRDLYLEEMKDILGHIDNVYDNDLGIIKNLYLYMISNDLREELIYYLATNPTGKIIYEDGNYYWSLPFFRNKSIVIPDDLFKIKVLLKGLIKINDISLKNKRLKINDIKIPTSLIDNAKVVFQSRLHSNNNLEYKLKAKERNTYNLDIKLSDIKNTDIYDIYLVCDCNKIEYKFRISKKMINIQNKNLKNKKSHILYFTKNEQLSLKCINFNILKFEGDGEKLIIKTDGKARYTNLSFYLKDRSSKEKIHLKKSENNTYEINWDHFLDNNRIYDLNYKVLNKSYRLSAKIIPDFKPIKLSVKDISCKMYKTIKGNISIDTTTK